MSTTPGISIGRHPSEGRTALIQKQVLEKSPDITDETERHMAKFGVPLCFGGPSSSHASLDKASTLPTIQKASDSDSDESDSGASLANSETGEEAEGHLAEMGKGPNTKVHVSTEDARLSHQCVPRLVPIACRARVYRASAVLESAENCVIGKR